MHTQNIYTHLWLWDCSAHFYGLAENFFFFSFLLIIKITLCRHIKSRRNVSFRRSVYRSVRAWWTQLHYNQIYASCLCRYAYARNVGIYYVKHNCWSVEKKKLAHYFPTKFTIHRKKFNKKYGAIEKQDKKTCNKIRHLSALTLLMNA